MSYCRLTKSILKSSRILNFAASILSTLSKNNNNVVCVKYYVICLLSAFCGLSFAISTAAGNIAYPGETLQLGSEANPHLLILVGGALDRVGHKSMYKTAKAVAKTAYYAPVTVLYLTWEQVPEIHLAIRRHRAAYPTARIVLVGHSWGSDTVIRVGSVQNPPIDLAVTLDGVSTIPRLTPLEQGSIKKWVNAYGRISLWTLVGKWGEQPLASKNMRVMAGHSDVRKMYKGIDTLEILPVLLGRKPYVRPENKSAPGESTLFHQRGRKPRSR